MVDWAEERAISNSGITPKTDSRSLRQLLWITLGPIALAAIFVSLLWERSQLVSIGYETQRLMEAEETLLRVQTTLILEEETLKDPARIDAVARGILRMAPLRPRQVLAAAMPDTDLNARPTLAMARVPSPGSGTLEAR
jgi:cell division protein FtsL